jgi:hypothetical protein
VMDTVSLSTRVVLSLPPSLSLSVCLSLSYTERDGHRIAFNKVVLSLSHTHRLFSLSLTHTQVHHAQHTCVCMYVCVCMCVCGGGIAFNSTKVIL